MTSPLAIRCPESIRAKIPDLLWDLRLEKVAVLVGHAQNGAVEIADIWEARNLHGDPEHRFALKKRQWDRFHARAEAESLKVVGLIHSHPHPDGDQPSQHDYRFSRRYPDVLLATAVFHPWTAQLIWYDSARELNRESLRENLSRMRQLTMLFRW